MVIIYKKGKGDNMLTENKEDYLTEILRLEEDDKKVTGKILSELLVISQASVSEMLKKLKEEGLVNKDNTLSPEGKEIAREVVSKHRLWERFLVDNLHISWKEVHDQAHFFEHVTMCETFDALNKYLNYPKTCPHGGSIYINLEEIKECNKLTNLKVGESAKIVKVKDDKSFLDYIEEKNINLGDQVEILEINDFDKQRTVKINGVERTLSPKACSMLYVE